VTASAAVRDYGVSDPEDLRRMAAAQESM